MIVNFLFQVTGTDSVNGGWMLYCFSAFTLIHLLLILFSFLIFLLRLFLYELYLFDGREPSIFWILANLLLLHSCIPSWQHLFFSKESWSAPSMGVLIGMVILGTYHSKIIGSIHGRYKNKWIIMFDEYECASNSPN